MVKIAAIDYEGPENFAKVLHYFGLYEGPEKHKILCPFHEDINASMLIDVPQGNFFCFGCHAKGKAFDFVSYAFPDLNDFQKWRKLFEIIRSKKTEKIALKTKNIAKKNSKYYFQKRREAKENYRKLGQVDWEYLYKQKTTEAEYVSNRGYSPKALMENGVTVDGNNPQYSIIAPIKENGVFKGTVARTTIQEVERKRKYLYNLGFKRSNALLGNYTAGWVFITEGFYDWLKLRQFLHNTEHYNNCVAILGWKATREQIAKIKSRTNNVVSVLDKTITGRRGTRLLSKHFNVVRFSFLTDVKDAGDLDKYTFNYGYRKTLSKIKQRGR